MPKSKYAPGERINQYKNELYNDFNYLQGDIYDKLNQLENENISDVQKAIQKKKLLSVLPKVKDLKDIKFAPTSDFIRELAFGKQKENVFNRLTHKWEYRDWERLFLLLVMYIKNYLHLEMLIHQ